MGRVVRVSDLIEKREIVTNGQTIKEFAAEVGLGEAQARRLMGTLVSEGRVRRAFKKDGTRLTPVYIPNGNSKKS